MGELPISVLDFLLPDPTDVPFEIGRLETTHRLPTSTRPHRHRYYQILWIIDGAGVHTADFEEHAIRPQTVFLISPGQVHVVRVDRPPTSVSRTRPTSGASSGATCTARPAPSAPRSAKSTSTTANPPFCFGGPAV